LTSKTLISIFVAQKRTNVVPKDTKVFSNNITVNMKIYDLYQKKMPASTQKSFRKEFCETFNINREQFYRVIKTSPDKISTERFRFFANYFTNGSTDELIKLCHPKEVKSIVPQPKKLKI
jgi:hypothetical protein